MTSKPCEDMFNSMTLLAKQNQGGVMSEVNKWHRQVASTVLQDADRPDLEVSMLAKASCVKHVPADAFDAQLKPNFSMGEDSLEELAEDPPSWPNPSPMLLKQALAAWSAALRLNGDWAQIRIR